MPLITVKNLKKTFPAREGRRRSEALHDIDFTLEEKEFVVMLGPSGCGKSTLLRIIAELDSASSGSLTYAADLKPEQKSFVFQNFGILPWLTVAENIEIGLVGQKIPLIERARAVKETALQFGLEHFKDHYPHELSGGLKQRVGLARAFITKPRIIYLDEPFSELDFFTATHLRELLLTMWETQHTTVLMVSHYIDEAIALADRIIIFSDKPGHIEANIKNPLPRPRDMRSKEYFAFEDSVREHFARSRKV